MFGPLNNMPRRNLKTPPLHHSDIHNKMCLFHGICKNNSKRNNPINKYPLPQLQLKKRKKTLHKKKMVKKSTRDTTTYSRKESWKNLSKKPPSQLALKLVKLLPVSNLNLSRVCTMK